MPARHVRYGGSSAEMWLNCAGYAGLIGRVPKKPVGQAALEGTAQHECMDRLINDPDLKPGQFLGVQILGIEITREHVNALTIALEEWEKILDEYPVDAVVFSEQFVGLAGNADSDVGGTLDGAVCSVSERRAAIVDFKFGQIEVTAGTQNLHYGICARKSIPAFANIKELTSIIIQPAYEPAVDRKIYTSDMLDTFEQQVLTAIKLSKAANPHFTEGEWCEWCAAKLACPAKTQRLATLTAPNHVINLDDVGKYLLMLQSWDKWRAEAEERVHHELEHGVAVKGWKLVTKRATRMWIDEVATIARLVALRIPRNQFMIEKLVSPAKAEKLIPKGEVAKLANPVSSGTTIAPTDDKRPAVLPPAALGAALRRLT
jgi:hypothetical protein